MGNSHGKPVVFTDQVNLNHFRLLRVVGKGAFGKVRIVERKDTGCTFALKYIRKDEVVRSESVRNIIRERRMLEHLNHPFLCNLRYSFQDVEYLYIVVDLMTGGDLRFHISRKSFTEDAVRFWIAELGCAIKYIHTQGIVHRDVKPDNILLDADGHVHLADFNVASDFKPDKPLTSKSGTLAYLAPEVYEGKGYSCEVDWWSLGVVFYECIYNKRPFEAHNHDGLASKIRQTEPPFPRTNPPVSNACLITARGLLSKDRSQRVGAVGFESFTESPFFKPINFVALERKELEPVFKPSSEKTNFDATYDLEELLLEEAPLEARARRQKPREQLKVDATREEIRADELHRMIEKLFEPFDYTLAQYDKSRSSDTESPSMSQIGTATSAADWSGRSRMSNPEANATTPGSGYAETPGAVDSLQIPSKNYQNVYTESVKGSPPLPIVDMHANHPPRSVPGDYFVENLPPPPQPDSRPQSRPHSSRSTSKNRKVIRSRKAVQMDGGDSQESVPDVPTVQIAYEAGDRSRGQGIDDRDKRPSGMLAFLSRKKGRDKSPKSKERGVLGKEGARVVVPNP